MKVKNFEIKKEQIKTTKRNYRTIKVKKQKEYLLINSYIKDAYLYV